MITSLILQLLIHKNRLMQLQLHQKSVFSISSNETSTKPTKGAVPNRNYGQIITEEHAIQQLEERKQNQHSK